MRNPPARPQITLVGRCEVNYDGRAASYLPSGERLVIMNPDGTLLVHRDEQRTPVNWQPPDCHHNACIKNDSLILQSIRTSPHEEVEISFETLAQVTLLELDDPPDLALEGSEEDLRPRILANPNLLEAGFQPLMTERETTAGAVDIYGKDADGTPIHSDVIASILILGDPVDQTVLRRFKPGDVEESGSKWISSSNSNAGVSVPTQSAN